MWRAASGLSLGTVLVLGCGGGALDGGTGGTAVIAKHAVGIEGLTMRFVTADGQFDETLAAKAWLPTAFDTIVYPIVMAVTARASLQGSWQPLPGFDGDTVDFVVHLGVPDSTSYDGTVGLGTDIAAALDAAIFAERAMVGVWWSVSAAR